MKRGVWVGEEGPCAACSWTTIDLARSTFWVEMQHWRAEELETDGGHMNHARTLSLLGVNRLYPKHL
jgi:hypothetical protein